MTAPTPEPAMDDIELPPLPNHCHWTPVEFGALRATYDTEQLKAYARAAIAADRAKGGEAVALLSPDREAVFFTGKVPRIEPTMAHWMCGWDALFTRPAPAPERQEGRVCSCCAGKGYFAADANCPQCKGDGVAISPTPTQDAEQAAMLQWLDKNAKEVLLDPRRAASEICPDLRTKWEIPALICSGPIGGHVSFLDAIRAAMKREGA